jgi:glycosyltransferase involved in cell wall biosynthesis
VKILWHSNSPLVPTGYGNQTALFAPRLQGHHEMAISAFYGLEGAGIMWSDGIPIFPGLGGEFGNQYIAGHAAAFFGGDPKGGIVFTLMDVLALSHDIYAGLDTVNWTPVDHDPITPTQRSYFQKSSGIPLAMSRFGEERLEEFSPLYCPHGIDTEIFKPLDKKKVRDETGVEEDAFVVGIVAANKGNPSRKCFHESLQAFARLRERHENAILYLHTEISGAISAGLPLVEVATALGIPPEAIARADQYKLLFSPYPPEEMAAIFSSLDVLLNPSAGGGFELPVMEAAACGTPSITTDFSAMPEVAGPSPWKVGGQRIWTGQKSWQLQPSVDEIDDCLEDCYQMGDSARTKLGESLREHALRYDVDRVVDEFMLPALEEAEERLTPTPAPEPLRI